MSFKAEFVFWHIFPSIFIPILLCSYLIGFFLWNVDNLFCPTVKRVRYEVSPAALRPFTQLHGWWHACAGYATYIQVRALCNLIFGMASFLTSIYLDYRLLFFFDVDRS